MYCSYHDWSEQQKCLYFFNWAALGTRLLTYSRKQSHPGLHSAGAYILVGGGEAKEVNTQIGWYQMMTSAMKEMWQGDVMGDK